MKQIILFGSRARGDSSEYSDFDFVVIVDKKTPAVREKILDTEVEMMDKYERLFSTIIYDEREWKKASAFPLAWNISREGIRV